LQEAELLSIYFEEISAYERAKSNGVEKTEFGDPNEINLWEDPEEMQRLVEEPIE